MIGRLSGIILEKQPPQLLLDVGGVGYEVFAPMTTFYHLPQLGERAVLHTHFAVSETAHHLYGFHAPADRALFRQLIKVNGIGPKIALAIMSGIDTKEFIQAVRANRIAVLTKLPGIGKKTAERLVIEMRDKLPGDGTSASTEPLLAHDKVNEAESALVALGYKPAEASRAVAAVMEEGDPVSREELIRRALKSMLPGGGS